MPHMLAGRHLYDAALAYHLLTANTQSRLSTTYLARTTASLRAHAGPKGIHSRTLMLFSRQPSQNMWKHLVMTRFFFLSWHTEHLIICRHAGSRRAKRRVANENDRTIERYNVAVLVASDESINEHVYCCTRQVSLAVYIT